LSEADLEAFLGTESSQISSPDSRTKSSKCPSGETESSALLKEINKQPGMRPLTHDLTKNLLLATGYRVLKIMITELVSNLSQTILPSLEHA